MLFFLSKNAFSEQSQIPPSEFKLSNTAVISLLTCTAGEELYEAYGHSAIRVKDDSTGLDVVFNYGIFDFNQPNFYTNFVKGNLNYMVQAEATSDFIYAYMHYKRGVRELPLNLTKAERQKVLDFLIWNARPENKYYFYDYFFNNCSTKIRDIFQTILEKDLEYHPKWNASKPSFREFIHQYSINQPWGVLGIDLCLGSTIDTAIAPFHYMFLPDYLEANLESATILRENKTEKLGGKIQILVAPSIEFEKTIFTPMLVFSFILGLFLSLSWRMYKKNKSGFWLTFLAYLPIGLFGCVLVFLYFTDHEAAFWNFNVLWANPLWLLVLIMKSKPEWFRAASFAMAIFLGLFISFGWWLVPQQVPISVFPLVGVLFLRASLDSNFLSRLKAK